MTSQPDAGNGRPAESASPPATPTAGSGRQSDLDAYLAANVGRFTDDALYAALVSAGHSPDDVRAALARASSRRPESAAPRARRTILVAYFAVFALLSVGMLLNGRGRGYLMPDAAGGIGILAGSLGVALVASLVWVASRRAFGILVGFLVVAYFLAALSSGAGAGAIPAVVFIVLAIGGAVFMARRGTAGGGATADLAVGGGAEPDIAILLVLPMLLLIGVAGICLASGLPIPGGAG